MIISDTLAATLNHADGRMYDSKSAYYASVKAAGCEIVGNDASANNGHRPEYQADDNQIEADVVQTMKQMGVMS